ncbi:MAG: GIY-YIG nuclease family protein [Chitinophagaceae bacterium]
MYILYSKCINKFYSGHTNNLGDRIFSHTNSGSKSTKRAKGLGSCLYRAVLKQDQMLIPGKWK